MSVKYILLAILISPIFCEISNIDPEDVFRLQNQTITETDFNEQINFDSSLNSNFSNLVRISDLLDVFNIENIGSMWSTFGHKLNKNCSADMVKYLKGLQTGQSWAIKMDDASGHYTTGFLYGNNYWTGSLSLCNAIGKEESEETISAKKAGLSFGRDQMNIGTTVIKREISPFKPGFFVLRILVNETHIALIPRTIYVGSCLPSTCSTDDVLRMGRFSQPTELKKQTTILAVRSPTATPFNLWGDTTFIVLVVTTGIVVILLILGTAYDIYIRNERQRISHMKIKKESQKNGCTTYDLTGGNTNKNEIPALSVGIQAGQNNNNSDENLAVESVSEEDKKLSVYSELLLSFSIITNFNAICDRSVGNDTIPSVHGLRALSMAWVILGHTCIIVFKYSDNMELRKSIEKNFLFQTVSNGAFSVDTFFFLSGLLVAYLYFRTNAKGKLEKLTKGVNEITAGAYHFFGMLFYRFMRLTAPYLFVLGVVEVTMKYYYTNSVFDAPTMDHETCPKYWWRNILYINTLFPVEDMCMLWSWYLSDDTQFYIIGSIILIIAVRHFKMAASTLTVFMLSSWVTTAYVAYTNNHMPNSDDPLALFDKIYDKPWTRLGPYLIGMSVGWILFKTNCKIRMSKPTVIVGWLLSSACLLYLIYGLYNQTLTQVSAAAYSALSHSAWALSLAWIVIACSTGYGGYVNKLLSASCIYPFSRVTYCAYLVHPIVIRVLALNSDSPLHLGIDSMAIMFFGQVVSSYVLSFIVSLAFEAPVVTMLKILSPNPKKRT